MAPDPESMIIPYAGYYGAMPVYPEVSVHDMEQANEDRRKEAEAKFMMIAEAAGMERAEFHYAVGDAEQVLSRRGRVADMIVMARSFEAVHYPNVAEGVVFGCARPVLLVPGGEKAPAFKGNVLIAWNGSREAAHAVAFALPLLTQGKVGIVTRTEGRKAPALPAEALQEYLAHHNVRVDILPAAGTDAPVGASILEAAKAMQADMIVMGAWSHSRFREYVLGGVTEYMLHHADLPVFMMH